MDFAEVMEIENGLIQEHRVYLGWFWRSRLKSRRISPMTRSVADSRWNRTGFSFVRCQE